MTITEARTRVRNKLNQTDSTNTLYSDSDFIDHELNAARRFLASVLADQYLVKLRKRTALTVSSGIGAYPTDFLRVAGNAYVALDGTPAKRLDESERWRLRYLDSTNQNLGTPNSANGYYVYWEESDGVHTLPTATTIQYEYIKTPDDLDATDNKELPESVDDLTVDFAFESCMRSTRGDQGLALALAKNRGYKIRDINYVFS